MIDDDEDLLDDEVRERDEEVERRSPNHGSKLSVTRRTDRTSETSCVDSYAAAVGEFIGHAVGEFSFAIFGGWGVGKTTLANRISARLKQDFGFASVRINGWKYSEQNAVWANLHTSVLNGVLREIQAGSSLRFFRWRISARVGLALRVSLVKHGFVPIAVVAWASLLATVPLAFLLSLVFVTASVFGIAWLLLLASLATKATNFGQSALGQFMALTRYKGELGLQAKIEDDLADLLVAGFPANRFGSSYHIAKKLVAFIVVAIAVSATLVFAAAHAPSVSPKWIGSWLPVADDGRLLFALTVWWLAMTFAVACVFGHGHADGKLLLVVDDLDRCRSAQVLKIVESLNIMLDDPRIKERVRLLVLLESRSVIKAITDRFDLPYTDSRTAQEHFEKLFLCSLHLPPVSASEAIEVVRSFLPNAQLKGHVILENENSVAGVVFTEEERAKLEDAVTRICAHGVITNPRQIRQFVIRYQLARLLLKAFRVSWSPESLCNELVNAMTGMSESGSVDEVAHISRQVVWPKVNTDIKQT